MAQSEKIDWSRGASRELVKRWYSELGTAEESGEKVVYLFTSGSIAEFFRSFGFRVVLPEMNAIRWSMENLAVEMIHHGEALGYDPGICGYMKCDLGFADDLYSGTAPFGRIPPPDLLVVSSGGCSTYIKWFEALERKFECPLRIVDVPFVREDRLAEFDRNYIRRQLEELIPICEEISGRKFDIDRLREILQLSKQAIEYWMQILELGKKRPSPFDGFFEACYYMAPMTVWRGTEECVDYYRQTLEEIKTRSKQHTSPAGRERFRLLVDGAPPWPKIREFRSMFWYWGGVGVTASYPRVVCACDDLELTPEEPFEFLTDLAASSYLNWNLVKRRNFLEKLARDYSVDGIVIHSTRSCRPYSIGQLDLRNYFAREAGIPTLFVDSDVADPRYFSSAQIMNRTDTFFEALGRKKPSAI